MSSSVSSLMTVLARFIVPMALLCGGGLIAVALVRKATPKDVAARKRPALLSVLVGLWALGIGNVLFKGANLVVNAISQSEASTLPKGDDAWAWVGVSLLITAVLVAAVYALFELRRTAVRLFATYLLLQLGFVAAYGSIHHEAAATMWRSPAMLGDVILGTVTLGYAFHLKARAMLV